MIILWNLLDIIWVDKKMRNLYKFDKLKKQDQ